MRQRTRPMTNSRNHLPPRSKLLDQFRGVVGLSEIVHWAVAADVEDGCEVVGFA